MTLHTPGGPVSRTTAPPITARHATQSAGDHVISADTMSSGHRSKLKTHVCA